MEAIYSSFIQDYDEKEREDTAGRKTGGVNCACSFRLAKPYSTCIKLQYVFFSTREHSIKKETNRRLHGSCRYCKITIIAAENLREVTPAGMFTDASFM